MWDLDSGLVTALGLGRWTTSSGVRVIMSSQPCLLLPFFVNGS